MTSQKPSLPTDKSAWLSFIERVHKREIEFGLTRIAEVARRLGCLQFSCPIIMIAGSNGKGTTTHFLSEIYQQAGYRTGIYTSPHIHEFNERIKIDQQPINDSDLIAAFHAIENARGDIKLTFFEYTTLAACIYFKTNTLDVIILENGLGGRLDAVNVLEADCAVITTISLEHQDWLGDTREAIASEKAGILMSGKPFVCGELDPPAVLSTIAADKSCPAYFNQTDFFYETSATNPSVWQWSDSEVKLPDLPTVNIPIQNASTALKVIQICQNVLPVSVAAIKRACLDCQVAGRFQICRESPWVVADVAHNAESSQYLCQHYQRVSPAAGKVWCLFSMLTGKDVAATIAPWKNVIDTWVVVPIADSRGAEVASLTAAITALSANAVIVAEHVSVDEGYKWLLAQASPEDHIIIFGSFYLLGELRPDE